MDLWPLYALLGREVECPKGRGVLVQVFSGWAAVHVPGVRRTRRNLSSRMRHSAQCAYCRS